MGAEGYLVSPTVFKTDGGGGPAPVSSILTCPRHTCKKDRSLTRGRSFLLLPAAPAACAL